MKVVTGCKIFDTQSRGFIRAHGDSKNQTVIKVEDVDQLLRLPNNNNIRECTAIIERLKAGQSVRVRFFHHIRSGHKVHHGFIATTVDDVYITHRSGNKSQWSYRIIDRLIPVVAKLHLEVNEFDEVTLLSRNDWNVACLFDKRPARFKCSVCGEVLSTTVGKLTTGYGSDPKTDLLVCYSCCGKRDAEDMVKTGHISLYLTDNNISNWPGSLKFPKRESWRENGFERATFMGPDDKIWIARSYSHNSQIVHCRRK